MERYKFTVREAIEQLQRIADEFGPETRLLPLNSGGARGVPTDDHGETTITTYEIVRGERVALIGSRGSIGVFASHPGIQALYCLDSNELMEALLDNASLADAINEVPRPNY